MKRIIRNRIFLISGLAILLGLALPWLMTRSIEVASAADSSGYISFTKTIYNESVSGSTLSANAVGNNAATAFGLGQTMKVDIYVSNTSTDTQTISFSDVIGDASVGAFDNVSQNISVSEYQNGSYVLSGVSVAMGANVPNELNFSCAVSPGLWRFEYTMQTSQAQFPNYKDRLVAYPLSVSSYGIPNQVVDVSYVMFVPLNNSSLISQVYNTSSGNNSAFDLGLLAPGDSVDVFTPATGVSNMIQTNSNFIMVRNAALFGTSDQSSQSLPSCNSSSGSANASISGSSVYRGGSCVLAAALNVSVTDTVTNNVQNASTDAYVMVVPSDSIIGNIFVGSGSAANLILPGSHVSAGASSATSSQNTGYVIGTDSVSGWDIATPQSGGQIYRNVYMNANILRLTTHPDIVINPSTYDFMGPAPLNASVYITTCSINYNGQGPGCGLEFSNLAAPPPQPVGIPGGNNETDTNICQALGTQLGQSVTTGSGCVVYVKGNLFIDNPSSTIYIGIPTTLIASGNITVTNPQIFDSVNNPSGFGLIAIQNSQGTGGNISVSALFGSVTMQGMGIFATGTFSASNKKNIYGVSISGSIVANKVDLSGIQTNPNPDDINLSLQTDPVLSSNPPPGFSDYTASPLIQEIAP